MQDEEIEETHPSFGMIQLHRTSGGAKRRLFGSSIRDHAHTVRLTITDNAIRKHSLSSDSYSASFKNEVVEVEMSAAQFAEFLTTQNVGFGIPCTVTRKLGKRVEPIPELEVETDKIRTGFEAKMRTTAVGLKKARDSARAVIDAAKLSQKGKDELYKQLVGPIDQAITELTLNAPFVMDMFEEATERITKTAKAELDALVTHAIVVTGIEALKTMSPAEKTKRLRAGTEDEQ